ncbi:MAG: phosphoethanolamine--lipid A transferase [Proteobacteria bacterium]|nr:phosphoethanolamine--lipid A transferase [Pseudomonadota bacterium]MBU1713062.1 phosphoethanolamine--lipid A transferase [Pseudomonadota bacterium]
MTSSKLIILASIFLVLFDNISFFRNVTGIYPVSINNIAFLCSLAIVLALVIILLFTLVSSKYTTKPILILILLISSLTSYFMNSYNTVIDNSMIQNIVHTNIDEALDLFNFKLILYVLFLGVLPSIFIYKVDIKYVSLKTELISKLKIVMISILIIIPLIFIFSKFYTSFLREHKQLRYYTNPTYYIYSIGQYLSNMFRNGKIIVKPLGTDAKIPSTDMDRELIVLVVGEAARADRFSLNGYQKETNPLLKKENIISFSNVHSCGTSTEISLPCMFSVFGKNKYSDKKGKSSENLLDVLSHAGINILWRDNNSSSKGVALRIPYEDYRDPKNNPVCDIECRDEGMLDGLQEYIDRQKNGDILIVLHQMGNHGPAYYKRYPKSFEIFTPTCKTNELNQCTKEEIGNAYDNAILYTDYFLSKVINLLKRNSNGFETAMIFFSDHGESLGEKGLYLHGLPYLMAPESQKHIPAIFWFGDSFKLDKNSLRNKATNEYSQDNLFHTILGLMEVNTSVYDKNMDIINYDN